MLWSCFDVGNYRCFLQGPLPVANYTRIIIPGRFWTRPPSTKSTRMASSATPLHDSLIELAIPDAHAHAIKWYLKRNSHLSIFLSSFSFPGLTQDCLDLSPYFSYKSTLFCSAQCSGTLVWHYLDSYVIVGVYGALTIGCVWYAI